MLQKPLLRRVRGACKSSPQERQHIPTCRRQCSCPAQARQDPFSGVRAAFRGRQGSTAEKPVEVPQPSKPEAIATPPQSDLQDDSDILIELQNVHKSFGGKKVLRGTDIIVRRGEAVGIIGSSGSGKSTTLRLMAGLVAPDWGEVRICGRVRKGVMGDDPQLAELLQVGMVFQNGALFDSLSVGENVGFLLYEHTTLPPQRIQELTAASLAAVGLSGVENLQPAQLSGGMRKRVALARAIIRDDSKAQAEQVIMYDEPTAGLDPVASTVVEDLIRSLHRPPKASHPAAVSPSSSSSSSGSDDPVANSGVASYIVVTHQHSTIRRSVDRLIFLHEGKVVWQGSSHDFDTTDSPIVKQFRTGDLGGPIRFD